MMKMLVSGALALASITAATPASAGQVETAVALCKAEFLGKLDGASAKPALRIVSIFPTGKMTRVRLATTTDAAHKFDCRVDYRDTVVAAALDGSDAKVQQANRRP